MKPQGPEADFSRCDDTLEEGAAVPPENLDAKRWLMGQRFVHGMLRALQGADAESREARVNAILETIPRREARRVFLLGTGWATAAAALVGITLFAFGGFSLSPAEPIDTTVLELPKPEHVLAATIAHLNRPVDQLYDLTVTYSARMQHSDSYQLRRRNGGCFLLDGDLPMPSRSIFTAGCDGKVLWLEYPDKPVADGRFATVPLEVALQKHTLPSERMPLFGAEHLDFVAFLTDLPNAYDLAIVERIAGKTASDEPIVRLSATRQAAHQAREEREVIALVGERSGALYQLKIVIEFRGLPFFPGGGGVPKGPGRRGERERLEHEHPEREYPDREHAEREHAEREFAEHERGEGPSPQSWDRGMRPRRGRPMGSKEPPYHTLTFRYSEDVQLSTQEYAPPK